MKIWQLNFELDDYDNLVPINEFTVEEIQSFDGRSHLRQWKPVQVKRMEPEKGAWERAWVKWCSGIYNSGI